MFLAAQITPPLRWDCASKGDLAPPDFPLARQGCHRLLGKHNVLLQAPSTGLSCGEVAHVSPQWELFVWERRGRWIIFCNSSSCQHMERRTRQNPKRGSPGLSSALPCVIFNFPEDIGVGQGIIEAILQFWLWNAAEVSYYQLFTVMLRLVKVSSHTGRTQSSEYISTKQDLFRKETPDVS